MHAAMSDGDNRRSRVGHVDYGVGEGAKHDPADAIWYAIKQPGTAEQGKPIDKTKGTLDLVEETSP